MSSRSIDRAAPGAQDDWLRDLDPGDEFLCENRILLSTCGSTNDLGKKLALPKLGSGSGSHPWLIAAQQQECGKGRLGNRWISPEGGIYISIVLPNHPASTLGQLPLLAGIGLCRGVTAIVDSTCRLKWPNDLMVRGRKIGGILIETIARPGATFHVVIGFGVNYDSSPESCGRATTDLLRETTSVPPISEAAGLLIRQLWHTLSEAKSIEQTVSAYRAISAHSSGETMTCRVSSGTCSGTFLGFDTNGHLRLNCDGEVRVISSGEIVSTNEETIP